MPMARCLLVVAALSLLFSTAFSNPRCEDVVIECEKGQGGGEKEPNGFASGNTVLHMTPKSPSVSFPFFIDKEGLRSLSLRFSNDGEPHDMLVTLDNIDSPLGIFRTVDTRVKDAPSGSGWTKFKVTGLVRKTGEALGSFHLTKGHHIIHVHLTAGDKFGAALDRITVVDLAC